MVIGSDDFNLLRRLAFTIYDLNGDDHIGEVDVIAFDQYFCEARSTPEANCYREDIEELQAAINKLEHMSQTTP